MQVQWTLTNRIEHREDGGLGLEELENSLNDKDKLFNTYERDMRNLGGHHGKTKSTNYGHRQGRIPYQSHRKQCQYNYSRDFSKYRKKDSYLDKILNRQDQKRNFLYHIIIKILNVQGKESMLKAETNHSHIKAGS